MESFCEPLPESLIKTIENRLDILKDTQLGGKDSDWFKWNSRTPWVSLMSNVGYGGDYSLAKKYILDSKNQTSMETTYNMSKDVSSGHIPYRPFPTIGNINVKNKGIYGSLREATINIKCYTMDQLEDIERIYLIPATSVLLQWGWSLPGSYESTINALDWDDKDRLLDKNDQQEIYKDIQNRIDKSNGHYDMMMGIISDFSIKTNIDGTFDCSLTITTAGYSVVYANLNKLINKNDDEKESIKSFISDDNLNYTFVDYAKVIVERDNGKWGTNIDNTIYITWRFIEDLLIPIFYKSKKTAAIKSTYVDDNGKEKELVVSCPDWLRSIDPGKIIIPNSYYNSFSNFKSFRFTDDNNTGYLRGIYLNISYVKDIISNSETLEEMLQHFINDMMYCSCNIWNLILYLPENSPGSIKILDINNSRAIDMKKLLANSYIFKIYENQNIIRDFSIDSNLTDEFAHLALYALSNNNNLDVAAINIKNFYGANITDKFIKTFEDSKQTKINIPNITKDPHGRIKYSEEKNDIRIKYIKNRFEKIMDATLDPPSNNY